MAIRIGNAPCSWGVIENVAGERSGYERVLDEMAETGYEGTELGDWGFMPLETEALCDELAKRNLLMAGSWVNVRLSKNECFEESLENCLRAARQLVKVCETRPFVNLGDEVYEIPHRTLKAGRIEGKDGMSVAIRKTFVKNLEAIRKRVADETGVAVLFHHHVGTWIETGEEIDFLMNETSVDLCFDSGHCAFGGSDPVSLLNRYLPRIGAIHFKDCDPVVATNSRLNEWNAFQSLEHGIFPELGKGSVDFGALLNPLVASRYDGWIIVEQDVIPGMGNPKLTAGRNREFVKNLGF